MVNESGGKLGRGNLVPPTNIDDSVWEVNLLDMVQDILLLSFVLAIATFMISSALPYRLSNAKYALRWHNCSEESRNEAFDTGLLCGIC